MINEITINHKEHKIVLTKKFAKIQSDADSPAFERVCKVCSAFPTYEVVVREIRKKEGKESYKGLTYRYMERYIRQLGTNADREKYQEMRLLAQCHSIRFPVIKNWFLERFPAVKQYGVKDFQQENAGNESQAIVGNLESPLRAAV